MFLVVKPLLSALRNPVLFQIQRLRSRPGVDLASLRPLECSAWPLYCRVGGWLVLPPRGEDGDKTETPDAETSCPEFFPLMIPVSTLPSSKRESGRK